MNIVACSVAVDIQTSLKGLTLANDNRDIMKNFVGIHPEAAGREDVEAFSELFSKNLDIIDGIGEIGLDKTYDENGRVPYKKQVEVFMSMLRLAESSGKPISVHSRKSLEEILDMLPSYRLGAVLLHWFAGSKKQLAKASDMGLYFSFGPVLVYSNEKQVLLKNAPKNRILVETDGPVVYSHCFEGLPASPTSFLVTVVSSAARALGLEYGEAADLFEKNALSYISRR